MLVWWTKTSSPPVREMKPKPFSLLKNFTVPCILTAFLRRRRRRLVPRPYEQSADNPPSSARRSAELGPYELASEGGRDPPRGRHGLDDSESAASRRGSRGQVRACRFMVVHLDPKGNAGPGIPDAHLAPQRRVGDHVGDELAGCQCYLPDERVLRATEQ